MTYLINELRRCSEAGHPSGLLFEHLHEISEREKHPPPSKIRPIMKTEGAGLNGDVVKKQKPFYTREQIIEGSIPPFINYVGNNLGLICSTTAGEEIKIEDKGKTIDIMV